jgi:hypothetical protein
MTALPVALAASPASRPLTRRLTNVVRLHLANPSTIITTPLIILGLIFAVNWVIWWIVMTATSGDPVAIQRVSEGFQFSGATFWIFIYMLIVAIQAMNLTFSFALGFGSTRRDFYLGSTLTFAGLSAFYSLLYTGLSILESVTNGWGVNGAMFRALYFGLDENWALRLFHVFATFLFFFFVGAAIAAMYVRWKQRGLIGFFAVFAFLVLGGIALITFTSSWGDVGTFFATVGFTGGYALSLIPTIVAAVAGYAIMRRATPRS